MRCIEGHTDLVPALVMTPDSKQIVSGSWDKTIKIWDLSSGGLLHNIQGNSGAVYALAMTPDGQQVISGNKDGTVKVWDLSSGRLLHNLEGHTGGAQAVAVTADGQKIVSGGWDAAVKVWDLSSGRLLHNFRKPSGGVSTVATTPDGQRIVSGSHDRTIRVWDLSGEQLYSIEHGNMVYSVAVTPDGRQIISGGGEYGGSETEGFPGPHPVRVWDLSSGGLLRIFKGDSKWEQSVEDVTVTPDGKQVFSACAFNIVGWDLKTGNGRSLFQNDQLIYCLALSLDGRWMSAGDHRGRIWVFELAK
ncbi:MAG: WD40 repeat domain-containing protein [Anaerolineales bacterium]